MTSTHPSRQCAYRVRVAGFAPLAPPLCALCETVDGMYVLRPSGDVWRIDFDDCCCGYSRMTLAVGGEPDRENVELCLTNGKQDFHRFRGTRREHEFLLAWDSETPGVPCTGRAAEIHVEAISHVPAVTQAAVRSGPRSRTMLGALAGRTWNLGPIANANCVATSERAGLGRMTLYLKLGRDGQFVTVQRATSMTEGTEIVTAYAALVCMLVERQPLSDARRISADRFDLFLNRQEANPQAAELAIECLQSALAQVG